MCLCLSSSTGRFVTSYRRNELPEEGSFLLSLCGWSRIYAASWRWPTRCVCWTRLRYFVHHTFACSYVTLLTAVSGKTLVVPNRHARTHEGVLPCLSIAVVANKQYSLLQVFWSSPLSSWRAVTAVRDLPLRECNNGLRYRHSHCNAHRHVALFLVILVKRKTKVDCVQVMKACGGVEV